jgi:hypothetical protein
MSLDTNAIAVIVAVPNASQKDFINKEPLI